MSWLSGCAPDYSDTIDTVAVPLDSAVKSLGFRDPYYQRRVQQKTAAFYEANEHKKHWIGPSGTRRRFDAFAEEVDASAAYGMSPDDYALPEIRKSLKALYEDRKRSEEQMSAIDIRITASFFLFTTHLMEGRIRHAGSRDFVWSKGMPQEDDVEILLKQDGKSDLRSALEELHPTEEQYDLLRKALADYQHIQHFPAAQFPTNISIKPGERHRVVPMIRRRLTSKNDLASKDSLLYDTQLEAEIKKFQRQFGLEQDGIIGPAVLGHLNTPPGELAEKLVLNLERLRWHPRLVMNESNVVVNVPEYVMRVYEEGEEKIKMRVVLGSEFNPTPIFHDTLTYLVFSPTWTVPESIIAEEFVPKLVEDPAHFDKEQFRFLKNGEEIDPEEEKWDDKDLDIAQYQVIQNPGEANSLGKVKFMMPNSMAIYLHDTPADHLFSREERAMSHGCIRLERPEEFAGYLLRDKKDAWDNTRMRNAMNQPEPETVKLEKKYPVSIIYRTAWVDSDGLVRFFDDVYGHDERQLQRLRKATTLLSRAK